MACVAQAAADHDEGVGFSDPPGWLIEENFWRAIRYGLDGRMIDTERRQEFPAAAIGDRLLAWTAPARAQLKLDVDVPEVNGARRQRAALADGATMREVFAAEVAHSGHTYAGGHVPEPATRR